jgi:hypothetical protein
VPIARERRSWATINADPQFASLRDRILDLVRRGKAAA